MNISKSTLTAILLATSTANANLSNLTSIYVEDQIKHIHSPTPEFSRQFKQIFLPEIVEMANIPDEQLLQHTTIKLKERFLSFEEAKQAFLNFKINYQDPFEATLQSDEKYELFKCKRLGLTKGNILITFFKSSNEGQPSEDYTAINEIILKDNWISVNPTTNLLEGEEELVLSLIKKSG